MEPQKLIIIIIIKNVKTFSNSAGLLLALRCVHIAAWKTKFASIFALLLLSSFKGFRLLFAFSLRF